MSPLKRPLVHTTPFVISRAQAIKPALRFLNLNKEDVFLDIGCGDGRVMEAALLLEDSKKPDLCLGIEANPDLCARACQRLEKLGPGLGRGPTGPLRAEGATDLLHSSSAATPTISCGNGSVFSTRRYDQRWHVINDRFENALLRPVPLLGEERGPPLVSVANKVYFFLDIGGLELVAPILREGLPAGARVVSFDFPIPDRTDGFGGGTVERFFLKQTIPVGQMDLYCYEVHDESVPNAGAGTLLCDWRKILVHNNDQH